jgi:hypothetical protein
MRYRGFTNLECVGGSGRRRREPSLLAMNMSNLTPKPDNDGVQKKFLPNQDAEQCGEGQHEQLRTRRPCSERPQAASGAF